ncbi:MULTISPECIES: ParB/RepB/Spo0J family partition protein [unclassified Pseudoclavibacter]|uniref:ParB/RepB/Spo0J family partition protein n=1 Tax=unclassified Pseudoclavibacter TaxID=2615177 RepID=UPI001BA69796|nr:ParB/RepB/Spo0J family partition protein [Pseudoclavibacter sp. Marseille-Q4354]MBS3177726.1 ParB/RepB/Spo0J family partition protein [Pseudoclavibacter sp. Marseille-Q4354]
MTPTTTPPGTLEHVAPADLVIEENVRQSAPLTPDFIRSIKENGVITPVLAHRRDGVLVVRAGQRRTLAAREAGLQTIPVYTVEADDELTERIVLQLVENDQREELTTGERVESYKQLELAGLKLHMIVKRTGAKRETVKTALAVAHSDAASRITDEHQLTLEQAAALVEFEDDAEVLATLTDVVSRTPGQFEHELQRQRDERARRQIHAAAQEKLREQGFEILDDRPSYSSSSWLETYQVSREDGGRVSAEHLVGVPGVAVHVVVYRGREAANVEYFLPVPVPEGFKTNSGAAAATKGPMNDEQLEERRTVIANNKAWDSAETVRRAWLSEFLGRTKFPTDALQFVAIASTRMHRSLEAGMATGNDLAHRLMSIERKHGGQDLLGSLVTTAPNKATQVLVAVALAGIESTTSRNTWRTKSPFVAEYFERIEAWGYTLSDVERLVVEMARES